MCLGIGYGLMTVKVSHERGGKYVIVGLWVQIM